MNDIVIVLHNIRSVFNVASAFRTAEGAGARRVYITGYTPSPVDRFGNMREAFTKVSLGAEKTLPWKCIKKIDSAIDEIRNEGFTVVGVEQSPDSISYANLSIRKKLHNARVAFVFGNEVRGLSSSVLRKTDILIEIPMAGEKESLNVSVALGVILFTFRDFIL